MQTYRKLPYTHTKTPMPECRPPKKRINAQEERKRCDCNNAIQMGAKMQTYDFRGILIDKEDYKYKLQGKRVWNGINISIENKKGSIRSGIDPNGKPWSIKMKYAYGRIPRTEGADGDQIDVYLGDDLDSELVFIVHQQDPWKKCYDEDKIFIGFKTKKQVEKAFKEQYNRPGFLGPIDIVSIEVFKDMIKDKSRKGKSIGSSKITDFYRKDSRIKDAITNLVLGILIEMEHTDNVREAEKIATDHLKEDSDYYINPDHPFIEEAVKELSKVGRKRNTPLKLGWTDDKGEWHCYLERENPSIADVSPITELLLTPLIKKLMMKLGFSRMRWIGRGWFVSITAAEYGKFLLKIPMLKVFDSQLKKFGYEIRINPLGFFIEPLRNGK